MGPFPQFLKQKKFFPKTVALPCTSSRNSEKPYNPIPRKHPDRRQDGRTDRPYFVGFFQLLLSEV